MCSARAHNPWARAPWMDVLAEADEEVFALVASQVAAMMPPEAGRILGLHARGLPGAPSPGELPEAWVRTQFGLPTWGPSRWLAWDSLALPPGVVLMAVHEGNLEVTFLLSPASIERWGIMPAQALAMGRAIEPHVEMTARRLAWDGDLGDMGVPPPRAGH